MDKETQAKFDLLPQQVKDFMDSTEIPERISAIGDKYGLHIDQVGTIQEETAAVILGMAKPEDFVDAIEERARLSTETAISIAADVNVQVLIPVKNLMTGSGPTVASDKPQSASVDRESLLTAIENPAPTEHPISIAQAGPAEKTRPSSGVDVAHEFIGEKLTAPVSLPSQKTVLKEEPQKASRAADPYREPIS